MSNASTIDVQLTFDTSSDAVRTDEIVALIKEATQFLSSPILGEFGEKIILECLTVLRTHREEAKDPWIFGRPRFISLAPSFPSKDSLFKDLEEDRKKFLKMFEQSLIFNPSSD